MHTWSARVAHGRDSLRDRAEVAPRHDRVDEPVAAVPGEVVVAETEVAQVVRVVRQGHVNRGVPARGFARSRRIPVEHHGQLDADHRVRAEYLARLGHVLGWHEVGMSAGRSIAGETEHFRTQRGEHARVGGERNLGTVERVEELDHLRERFLVATRMTMVDEWRVTDSEAEHEAALPVAAP